MSRNNVAAIIEDALLRSGKSQGWLGGEVARLEKRPNPYSQPTVSQWLDKIEDQPPSRVFWIADALGLKRSVLSRPLGYVPAEDKPAKSVLEAIDEEQLTETAKEILRGAYRAARRT